MSALDVGTKHKRLLDIVFCLGMDGNQVLEVDREFVRQGKDQVVNLVFNKNQVASEFYDALVAAPLMYQQLNYQYGVLQSIIDALEEAPKVAGTVAWIHNLTVAQNALMRAMRAATEGVEKVAQEAFHDKDCRHAHK